MTVHNWLGSLYVANLVAEEILGQAIFSEATQAEVLTIKKSILLSNNVS